MSKTFFISDTHFGHSNIIRLANRPFKDVDEMDKAMIENWNRVVSEGDTVWHLGDFCWDKTAGGAAQLLGQLQGRKRLVCGNHDGHEVCRSRFWSAPVEEYAEIMVNNKVLVLFHYPITDWNRRFRGSVHLSGHVHGADIQRHPLSFDVGVEKMGYTPRTLDEILASNGVFA
jgi:calcineurin-like phosphoesterase family protein